MRTALFVTILALVLAGTAAAQCVDRLAFECAELANYPGDVCVTLKLSTCQVPFDAFGVEVIFPAAYMTFSGFETTGMLTADWDQISAVVIDGSPNRLRIGGYDPIGFGVQTREALIRLCFSLTAQLPSGRGMVIDDATMVDCLATAESIDCLMPSITPIETSTWGKIKALFELQAR